ncbi:MAG TPA: BBP7 family outer membrane beta-barrel protein, partial [Gemmataceae bacterium]|nr:BBP7 family outer membrane beta-barrel protein [Gemmataceae bacterium]
DTWEEFDLPPGPVITPYPRFYASAEHLLWNIRPSRLPPLVTTGVAQGGGVSGNLGGPGTAVLFGGSSVDNEDFSGGRFTAGWWFGEAQRWGVEGSFLFLGQRSVRFSESSAGGFVLARPFFNLNTGQEDREVVAAPGLSAGAVGVGLSSRLLGAELNALRNVWCGPYFRADLLGGFRYLNLTERLSVSENVLVLPTADNPFAGDQFFVLDQFGTSNNFYGGQLGVSATGTWRRWSLNLRTKVALGDTHQAIRIAGLQQLTSPTGVQAFPGGLLALPSNNGYFTRDRFSVVPEVGVNLGFQATSNLRLFVGYTFLFWSNVARPGDQVDRVLDVSQVPNRPSPPPRVAARPAVPFKETGFWAHGVNFGLQFTY